MASKSSSTHLKARSKALQALQTVRSCDSLDTSTTISYGFTGSNYAQLCRTVTQACP